MNIQELSKKMTRDEFLKGDYVEKNCPSDYGLKEFEEKCEGDNQVVCKKCWEAAIKDIKFKDESIDTATAFLIVKDPLLKCKRISDGLILSIEDGLYKWESGDKPLAPDDLWTVIKDEQVDFMEAAKAYENGKEIYCLTDEGYKHNYLPSKSIWNFLKDEMGDPISSKEILNGTWFIKA